VTVYQDAGFRGVTARFDGDVRDLRGEGWNDTISSVRVQPGDRFRGRFGQQVPRQGACFYTDADFEGNRYCVAAGDAATSMPLGFNDAISSIEIVGGASVTIFEDANFSGQATQISSSIRDLAGARSPNGFRWNDAISSVRVQASRFNPADRFGGGAEVPRRGACFFTDAGFQGNRFCASAGDSVASMPPGFNDEISSIQLFGGAAVIMFEHDNFGGQSIRIVGAVRDLQDARSPNGFRWNDAASSLRVF
jgi:hypothetical protein